MKRTAAEIIKSYIFRHTRIWLWGIVTVLLTTLFSMAAPWILRQAINSLQEGVTSQKLLLYAGMIIGVTLVQGVFRFLMSEAKYVVLLEFPKTSQNGSRWRRN